MSLFRQPLRPDPSRSEQAVARFVASIRAHLEPDPLFERRLRGRVVNQFVAMRQSDARSAGGRHMGVLGRAVLYASVTLAVTVGGALAASQEALPGDTLYPLKRQVERLRVQVLPAHLHDDLVAIQLTERLDELDRLTRLGRSGDAGSLLSEIRGEYAQLMSVRPEAGTIIATRLLVLEALVDRLPDGARAAVQEVIEQVERDAGRSANPGLGRAPASPPAHGSDNATGRGDNSNGKENGNAGGVSGPSTGQGGGGAPADPGSAAERSADPKPSPRPTKSPKASD